MAKEQTKVKEETTALAPVAENRGPAVVDANQRGIQGKVDAIEVYDADEHTEETGLENVSADERRIPIMRILDPKSPQCKPVDRGGLGPQGAGMIYNTSTGQVYDGRRGLYMIVANNDRKFVKYKKREPDGSGGGFLAIYEPEDPFVKECEVRTQEKYGNLFRKWDAGTMDDGTDMELVDTRYLGSILIVPNPDGSFPGEHGEAFGGLVPFASTQIKKHGAFIERNKNMRYNFKMKDGSFRRGNGKLWSHVWLLQSTFEERGSQSWYGWQISLAAKDDKGMELPYPDSRIAQNNDLYKQAEDLRTVLLEGAAKIDYEKDSSQNDDAARGSGGGGGYTGGDHAGEDIPFDNR